MGEYYNFYHSCFGKKYHLFSANPNFPLLNNLVSFYINFYDFLFVCHIDLTQYKFNSVILINLLGIDLDLDVDLDIEMGINIC